MSEDTKHWRIETALQQIESCKFECEAGSIENNTAYIWLKKVLEMTKTVNYPDGFVESDDCRYADPFWGALKKGQTVKAYDETVWTVVYSGLGGIGVIEGEHPEFAHAEDGQLPEPTNWLREPYAGLSGRPLGQYVHVTESQDEPL